MPGAVVASKRHLGGWSMMELRTKRGTYSHLRKNVYHLICILCFSVGIIDIPVSLHVCNVLEDKSVEQTVVVSDLERGEVVAVEFIVGRREV
jgi:hypothetical protein